MNQVVRTKGDARLFPTGGALRLSVLAGGQKTKPEQKGPRSMKRNLFATIIATSLLAAAGAAQASDIGHFNCGVYSIRDYFVPPDPGVYGALYNYFYRTDRVNDNNGNKITTGPGGLTTFDLDVNLYALAPVVIWATPYEILGAKYAA